MLEQSHYNPHSRKKVATYLHQTLGRIEAEANQVCAANGITHRTTHAGLYDDLAEQLDHMGLLAKD